MKRFILLMALLLLTGVAACGGAETASPTPTETAVLFTSTPTREATVAPIFTPTAAPTETAVPTITPASPETIDLEIKGFLFRPERLEVTAGTEIVWTNQDDIQHSVTYGTPDEADETVFDSGFFVQGEQYAMTFAEPGEFPYFCKRHPHMQATVVVLPTDR